MSSENLEHFDPQIFVTTHPSLTGDEITERALNEGIDAREREIANIKTFLEARDAFLTIENAKRKLQMIKAGDPEILNAVVVNSVRPDLEKWLN